MNWNYFIDIIDSKSTPIDTLLRVLLFRYEETEGESSSKPRAYTISQKLLSHIIQSEIDSSVMSTYGVKVSKEDRDYFESMLRICDIFSSGTEDKTRDEIYPLLQKFIQYFLKFLPQFSAKEISEKRSAEMELLLKEDEDDPSDENSRWLTQKEIDKQFPTENK